MALQVKFTLIRDLWDEAGKKQTPRLSSKTFTPAEVRPQWLDLAAATAVTLYLPTDASEQVASFDYLLIDNPSTTATVEVECTCNDLHASEQIDIKTIPPGGHLLITSNVSRYNIAAAADGFAATADVIDKVRLVSAIACKVYVEIGK